MQWAKRICCFVGLCTALLINHACLSQEICNNGIDDDGDGLIDLQDPDCQCHFTVSNNLLLNGSFELYNHCPIVYTYDSNYNAAPQVTESVTAQKALPEHQLTDLQHQGRRDRHEPPGLRQEQESEEREDD